MKVYFTLRTSIRKLNVLKLRKIKIKYQDSINLTIKIINIKIINKSKSVYLEKLISLRINIEIGAEVEIKVRKEREIKALTEKRVIIKNIKHENQYLL
jgi:hypothetical protein